MNFCKILCWVGLLVSVSAAGALGEEQNAGAGHPKGVDRKPALLEHFYGFEPFYFLYGWNPDNIKFQISFKYRLLNPEGSLARNRPRLADFYFGYAQTSFIDLDSPSDAFLDNSFKPEFMFSQQNLMAEPTAWVSQLGLEAGVQHQSNGDSGTDSRSLNLIYAKPIVKFGDTAAYHLTVAPKIWLYLGNLRENPDIADYWGYVDLELKFGKPDGLELRSNWRQGSKGGSLQLDLTYPFSALCFGNCNGYFQVQYFSGYAETLVNYNQKDAQIRIGFALFR